MPLSLSFASLLSGVQQHAYAFTAAWSVYIGMVRASLQERLPILGKHVVLAVGLALLIVVCVQALIALLSLFTLLWEASRWTITAFSAWVHALPFVSSFREER
ncbi:MAG: hypothetical protein IPJ89_04640 [Candidatus Iainarchaeum archaeon]|uniref:Uncharacterized protein n=1 Tax=Candidatus Iainarchaeum sp. TaxID=3101447 RepID=A0A7T9DJD3_9ARCH|nr:MAG: hypothetical protein IPJ89_04640 [Candidatus Diapherotrites archaeon]